mmetsp:Transcript_13027/g.34851  ORF Transcript_13027/g.34851 Transcript_13027/m.34851 type:complete len:249 (-) Transcript_13027:256-1002(-)
MAHKRHASCCAKGFRFILLLGIASVYGDRIRAVVSLACHAKVKALLPLRALLLIASGLHIFAYAGPRPELAEGGECSQPLTLCCEGFELGQVGLRWCAGLRKAAVGGLDGLGEFPQTQVAYGLVGHRQHPVPLTSLDGPSVRLDRTLQIALLEARVAFLAVDRRRALGGRGAAVACSAGRGRLCAVPLVVAARPVLAEHSPPALVVAPWTSRTRDGRLGTLQDDLHPLDVGVELQGLAAVVDGSGMIP